jgi:hypothetical protein
VIAKGLAQGEAKVLFRVILGREVLLEGVEQRLMLTHVTQEFHALV